MSTGDDLDPYDTDYEVGRDNMQVLGMDLHNPVFFLSAGLILAFVGLALVFPSGANDLLSGAREWVTSYFDWLFSWATNLFIVFCLALAVLPVRKIRLGGQNAKPGYSILSWFAMLFAAGMGVGLMFWSVAEPVAHYTGWSGTPLNIQAQTDEAEYAAIGATMFHWGLHAWAIYAVVGLSLAFFAYTKGMPLTVRSAFYPLLGERCWGWPGHLIDLLAVLATIFGLATSLGLGAQQAAAGLHFLFGSPNTTGVQIGIIAAVTGAAVFSVVRGIDKGVKLLSNVNMAFAAVLLALVIFLGQGTNFFAQLAETASAYAALILPLSNPFGRDDSVWFHGWTVFFWAWWISWSPFVGMFIARISKGRTILEFVIAVLLVPTLLIMIWMSAFGGTGLGQAASEVGQLSSGISDVSLAMFQMLENLPLAQIASILGITLVLVFFITSSDSASLVIDSITAGGKVNAPVPQRVFWATLEGIIAATLLYGGGSEALQALQAGAIATGLPFTVVLLLMCYSLYKGLAAEQKLLQSVDVT